MARRIPTLLAALALAGCLEESRRIEVSNRGVLEAELTVEYDVWVDAGEWGGWWETRVGERTLSPGDTWTEAFPDAPVHVTVVRIVDGLVLYDEWLSDGDFEEEHGRIEIAVYP